MDAMDARLRERAGNPRQEAPRPTPPAEPVQEVVRPNPEKDAPAEGSLTADSIDQLVKRYRKD